MFRSALNKLGVHSEGTGMIGDRMDTDIVAGIADRIAHSASTRRGSRDYTLSVPGEAGD
ncbi:HAD hydrolase-like protein [Rhizobium sp. 28DA2]|uniref:HAD hydrolase-like protein n=1 Tax=Rhizobium sp. 28DA2 TaxID=3035209 RepID=UPI0034E84083